MRIDDLNPLLLLRIDSPPAVFSGRQPVEENKIELLHEPGVVVPGLQQDRPEVHH